MVMKCLVPHAYGTGMKCSLARVVSALTCAHLQCIGILYQPQRLGRQNSHMGLWPLGFQSYGPFLKSMGHYSNGVGQKKRNIGIFVSDVTFRTVS